LASFPAVETGNKVRARSASFADHYSQARQFYLSQTPVEQGHIKDAVVFELSKVKKAYIRERMVAHLENIDKELATRVANGLGIKQMPAPAKTLKPTILNLPPSPALSILRNGPASFKGRKVGVLLSDGGDANLYNAVKSAVAAEGATLEVIAPTIGGVDLNDGTHVAADQKINGGPSVLYDSVVLLLSDTGAAQLANEATAKDFVSDAFNHLKVIAHNASSTALMAKAGVAPGFDEGIIEMRSADDSAKFIAASRKIRIWNREDKVKMPG
jgi:catalase